MQRRKDLDARLQPPPIERIHRAYRDDVIEFAEAFGCTPNWLAAYFEEFTFMRMHEMGAHKNLAAWMAWNDCIACFSKVGSEPD